MGMTVQTLVVFDIDGTLVDSVAVHQAALASAIEATDLTYRDTVWSNYANHTDSGVFCEAYEKSHGRAPDSAQCRLFESSFAARYEERVAAVTPREIPGARHLLERLDSSGQWRVAFATGSYRGAAEHKLRLIGIRPECRILVTATDYRTRREIVARVVQLSRDQFLPAAQPRVVSVGDGPWDAKTAAELGIAFIGVGHGAAAQRLNELGARAVVPDFLDPARFLRLLDTSWAPAGKSSGGTTANRR